MSVFKEALGNAKLAILSLLLAFLLSFVLNIVLSVLLYNVPKHMTVFVPPNIPESGVILKSNQISDAQVYRFTYSTWVSLMTWTRNGEKAFSHHISENAPYLTESFQNSLREEMVEMREAGFLYQHTQISFGAHGSSFNSKDVKYLGNGTWLVHLEIRTINYVDALSGGFKSAHVASDAETSFIFKVTRVPLITGENMSGLAIDGFAISPKVVKVYA